MSELEPTRTYSNHTATYELDYLRLLLDMRGLEWREHEAPATDCIAFFDGNGWHDCWESVGGEVNVTFSMTPEQAIAATLGATDTKPTQAESSGTCQIETTENWLPAERYHRCKECGAFFAVLNASHDIPPRCCPNCGRRIEQ